MKRMSGPGSSIAAGLLAAFGASVCCVVPLALLSLGIGGAWVAHLTALEPLRPFFALFAVGFLALAFRSLYLVPARCEPGATCSDGAVRRRQRVLFWLAGIFILGLLAAPWAAGLLA